MLSHGTFLPNDVTTMTWPIEGVETLNRVLVALEFH